jgi:hypothetical protein
VARDEQAEAVLARNTRTVMCADAKHPTYWFRRVGRGSRNEHGLDSLLDNGGPQRSLGVPICRYVGNDSVIHSASQSAFGC